MTAKKSAIAQCKKSTTTPVEQTYLDATRALVAEFGLDRAIGMALRLLMQVVAQKGGSS